MDQRVLHYIHLDPLSRYNVGTPSDVNVGFNKPH